MKFLNPASIISQVHLSKGLNVVDFGFGSGAFLDILLKEIGQEGSLYAYDIDEGIIEKIKSEFQINGQQNIFFSKIDLEKQKTEFKNDSVDFILISSVLFMLKNKEHIIKEAYRILKKNGRLLIIDWKDSFANIGPIKESIFSEEEIKVLIKSTALFLERELDAGDYHYALVYRKK